MSKPKLQQTPNPTTQNDLSVNLDCGCLITYVRGDTQGGQMFLCRRHLSEDPFQTLKIVNEVGKQIRAGKTSFGIKGRD